jgi:hypothetical protein
MAQRPATNRFLPILVHGWLGEDRTGGFGATYGMAFEPEDSAAGAGG